ncbi:deoxyguanosinetriphosphate triphosphohydrolase [Rhodoblastus sphagnicola]|uniref:Deoxyguanosinetriphosphate triphosphohydrolase-like protein n=1 Tax=Rhodoblastus sphagnicola TaxID=333368 RepID=A0A2S6NCV8_9HYPH|nr:deoxyguanosinetriphosphate triphosphohydrolase [Rhodoblastus sphagnicola]MBB4196307.1 dGTPase [Rhodoblastus sphagnicola]PPQ32448.1 deoxyguanosinetriphosphate triphosphohydrolase [Rhodoblastus sphagnicola]
MSVIPTFALAPFASDWRASRGRLFAEPPSPTRGNFQRDRDRIIHSTAFRRLAHKTQVFIALEGDHFRTRLTHTMEVAQIARALARGLKLDEDLAETTALGHDLGHACFGHAGEEVLDACMGAYGGFDHNAQTLRIVTKLERRYAEWDGLNLCAETLEGLVKHNGPLLRPDGGPTSRYEQCGISAYIMEFNGIVDLKLEEYASAEAQCAALADDIAYNAHDIDDGLRAGLFAPDDLRDVPFIRALLEEIAARHPGLETPRLIHELTRRVITRLVEDVFAESEARLAALKPDSPRAIARAGAPVIAFSAEKWRDLQILREFLFTRMYRHSAVLPVWKNAQKIVSGLFSHFINRPQDMSEPWGALALARDEAGRARVVADYIAGMTDVYAAARAKTFLGDEG